MKQNKLNNLSFLRPWINQITWSNSCKIPCKINFIFYKISFWKFGKYNRKRWRTAVNFVWVKNFQKILQLTLIVDNFSNSFQKFYSKKVNRSALISFHTFPKFSEILSKLKKLFYMNELMYNWVTWSDWSMALTYIFSLPSL